MNFLEEKIQNELKPLLIELGIKAGCNKIKVNLEFKEEFFDQTRIDRYIVYKNQYEDFLKSKITEKEFDDFLKKENIDDFKYIEKYFLEKEKFDCYQKLLDNIKLENLDLSNPEELKNFLIERWLDLNAPKEIRNKLKANKYNFFLSRTESLIDYE